MKEPRKALGRGLSSLIRTKPATATQREPTGKVPLPHQAGEIVPGPSEVPVNAVSTNPHQPRRRFSETTLEQLTQSIRDKGLLQPLLVRRNETGFELIAGERRLRAARKAGLTTIPVVIRKTTEQEQLELALIENLQREDLNPIEEAQGYTRLAREFRLTQEEIAHRVGKERSTITNLLRLLKLTPVVQQMLMTGALSMGHARAILPVEDPRRQEVLAQRIEKEGLSVRQVEGLVRAMVSRPTPKGRRATDIRRKDPNLRHLAEELQRSLGTRVEIISRGKGGEIQVQYYSADDLRRLTDRLMGSA